MKEQQLYEVIYARFSGHLLEGAIVTLDNVLGSWYGPWYWGYVYIVSCPEGCTYKPGKRAHDKVRLKKVEAPNG
jgi:hypothetical protein